MVVVKFHQTKRKSGVIFNDSSFGNQDIKNIQNIETDPNLSVCFGCPLV